MNTSPLLGLPSAAAARAELESMDVALMDKHLTPVLQGLGLSIEWHGISSTIYAITWEATIRHADGGSVKCRLGMHQGYGVALFREANPGPVPSVVTHAIREAVRDAAAEDWNTVTTGKGAN